MELPANEEELETHCIWHEELIIALPENHPLAIFNQIDRQHLADQPIIWIAESLQPALHRWLLESRQRLGLSLRIAHEINTVFELFDLVEAGAGIGFVKRSLAMRVHQPGVVFRELCGPKLFIDTGVAYRPDNQSEALRVLITLLRAQPT
jgi:DNA-binding transcriptional LysR family regulator